MKHRGTLEDLQTIVKGCQFTVSEVKDIEHGHQIWTDEGAIINWYSNKGTVSVQGKPAMKQKFTDAWKSYIGETKAESSPSETGTDRARPDGLKNPQSENKKVFVVHGHDDTAREQLELILHKLELFPFVLANTSGGGLTIIEALEKEIGPDKDQARFGIVLMTPDDVGYSKSDSEDKAQPRARQNVVLEMGMLISTLGRRNVAILKKGHLEVPSDVQGILYIPFNEHVKETVPKLVDRLRKAGFVLNLEHITDASS